MQLITLSFAALAVAAPGLTRRQDAAVCSGSYQPQCCATNVLDLASLDCANPPEDITSTDQFKEQCSAEGQQALCCLLPIVSFNEKQYTFEVGGANDV
ncbi:Trihydrophobin [Pseudocercospora fuligena]|uniref:Trihydrophobin n=1 Tax=Pseudocercospora fuligena TaxID=685502 RepID=A0A8H6RQS3_9PEZI|nr:Trihydrophobin [Pseudocercospora fuligena]